MHFAKLVLLTDRHSNTGGTCVFGVNDVETQSLLASAYKDLCENTTDNAKKQDYADLAIARYEQAYLREKIFGFREGKLG